MLQEEQARLKPGSLKAFLFEALHAAGPAGLPLADLVDRCRSLPGGGGAPQRSAVLATCSQDAAFARVAAGRYALRALPGVVPAPPPPPRVGSATGDELSDLLGVDDEAEGLLADNIGSAEVMAGFNAAEAAAAEQVAELQAALEAARRKQKDEKAKTAAKAKTLVVQQEQSAAAEPEPCFELDASAWEYKGDPEDRKARMKHKQAMDQERERLAQAKTDWQRQKKAKVKRAKEELSVETKHIDIEVAHLQRKVDAAKQELQQAEAAKDAQLRAMGQVPDRRIAWGDDVRGGGSGGSGARGARGQSIDSDQGFDHRNPIDDDDVLADDRARAVREGRPMPAPIPAPDAMDGEAADLLVEEMAVSEFLLWFADAMRIRPLDMRDLHDALVTGDSETLCELYLGLLANALLGAAADKQVFLVRWRQLADANTWPEVLRRFVRSRHAQGAETEAAAAAADVLGTTQPTDLSRAQHLALLRSLTDAILETDSMKLGLDGRQDQAELLAKERYSQDLEERRRRRQERGRYYKGGDSEEARSPPRFTSPPRRPCATLLAIRSQQRLRLALLPRHAAALAFARQSTASAAAPAPGTGLMLCAPCLAGGR